ncbi:MAG: carotenoid 1,2-hydratase [Verrucomicrobiota bacterium]
MPPPPLHAETAGTPPPAPDPWQRAIGPWAWQFPRDHGAHPAFKTEWWYFTGNLHDAAGRRFGYQLTFFRQGIQFTPVQTTSRWAVRDFSFGHFAISDIVGGQFHAAEKVSRGALGEAHAATGRMDVAIGPWTLRQDGGEGMQLAARDGDMALALSEHPLKPLVLEGVGGLSQKADGAGQASYYYSYPRLATTGTLTVGGRTYAVDGLSWFDHEFSTSSLAPNQAGWDWFCLQLDTREEIMLYAMRDTSGGIDPHSEGTWVRADGTAERLPPGSFTIDKLGTWRSPRSGALYPRRLAHPRARAPRRPHRHAPLWPTRNCTSPRWARSITGRALAPPPGISAPQPCRAPVTPSSPVTPATCRRNFSDERASAIRHRGRVRGLRRRAAARGHRGVPVLHGRRGNPHPARGKFARAFAGGVELLCVEGPSHRGRRPGFSLSCAAHSGNRRDRRRLVAQPGSRDAETQGRRVCLVAGAAAAGRRALPRCGIRRGQSAKRWWFQARRMDLRARSALRRCRSLPRSACA